MTLRRGLLRAAGAAVPPVAGLSDTFTAADGTFDETRVPDTGAYTTPTDGEIFNNTFRTPTLNKTITATVARGATVTMTGTANMGALLNFLPQILFRPRWVSDTEGIEFRLTGSDDLLLIRLSDGATVATFDWGPNLTAGADYFVTVTDDGTTVEVTLDDGLGKVESFSTNDPEGASATKCQVVNIMGNISLRWKSLDDLVIGA